MNALRFHAKQRTLAALLSLILLIVASGATFAQSGPPDLPPIPFSAQNFYPLEAPPWADWFGDLPRASTNLVTAPSWDYDGTALSVSNVAFLQFDVFEDGYTNITFEVGSISTWAQMNWTSVTDGGTGPSNWAVLISIGNWTSNAAQSAWTLAIDPAGTNLVMEAQASGSNQVVFKTPIDFDEGDWALRNDYLFTVQQLAVFGGSAGMQQWPDSLSAVTCRLHELRVFCWESLHGWN